eukprot:TRINITY_DN1279_c0_g1_i1.p1 TRINITY_DN1279_c0_g1~~TRINITY_DN1279_c0_g1_i1.p1  ORF type:complete len:370 (+),score=121.39 TRINITY_DN1279_c0_g1_i1:89-1111(+)
MQQEPEKLRIVKLSLVGDSERTQEDGSVCTAYDIDVMWDFPAGGGKRNLMTVRVVRRFSDFYDLYYALADYPSVYNAEFPRRMMWGSTWRSVVDDRKRVLGAWLQKLCDDPAACEDEKTLEWLDGEAAANRAMEMMQDERDRADATAKAKAHAEQEAAEAKRALAEVQAQAAILQRAVDRAAEEAKEAKRAQAEAEAAAAQAKEEASRRAEAAASQRAAAVAQEQSDRARWAEQLSVLVHAAGHTVHMPVVEVAVSGCGGDMTAAQAEYFDMLGGTAHTLRQSHQVRQWRQEYSDVAEKLKESRGFSNTEKLVFILASCAGDGPLTPEQIQQACQLYQSC